ncbi:hypothetical protein AHAS_Ahas15G0261800 [Arachis hypogaea]
MQAHSIATSKIVGYMAGMAGGYSLLGFLKKDVYNYADKQRRIKIADGDANSAIMYLEGKAELDHMAIAKYNMLENLMEIMCGKKPAIVVTDSDKTMIKVVSEVLPSATHRLCAWHVEKNVTSNVKDVKLRGLFRRWLYAEMGTEDFESEWEQATDEYGLREKQWSCQMYDKRICVGKCLSA